MVQIITNQWWGGGWGGWEKYVAWQDIAISWGLQSDSGSMSISVSDAISLEWVIAYWWASQSWTPTPTSPVDIECNNWVLKFDGSLYADWTQETISDGTNVANAEILLSVSSNRDEQNLITWKITRNVKVLVLDWTEDWTKNWTHFEAELLDNNAFSHLVCTHFKNEPVALNDLAIYKSSGSPILQIRYDAQADVDAFKSWLASEYANNTPVMVLYALETPTTETVAWQTLALTDWAWTFTITASQISPLNIWVSYRIPWNIIDFTNETWYITEADLPDLSWYQTKSNLVTSLTNPDDTHYPSAKAVSDAISWGGAWDMLKSVYDPNNVNANAFDYNNFINTPTIPTDNCQLANWCDYATCCYVNDSINSVTAYYITKNAQGDQFATYAELAAATTFYSGGVVRVPTRNDYTIVLADELHDDATTRYIYNSGWEYQYTVNETALTQAQLDAINSGITAAKVTCYDSCYAQCCDIPTDNCQLSNGCGYTTCTWTLSTCSDVISALWYTPYSSTNPSWYTTCTWTLQSCDIACINGCCLTNGWDICIQWGTWDMAYSDFNFQTKSWASFNLDLASTITPSQNFTINAPSEIKDGQTYILRVNNWDTAYTMTLGTNIINPYSTPTTLTANWLDQFIFLAVGWKLELQPEIPSSLEKPMVDLLIVAWWWAWWWTCNNYNTWWGWGWGQVIQCYDYQLCTDSYSVSIWSGGVWWQYLQWCNWWDSCFWNIVAYWWWGWWVWCSGCNSPTSPSFWRSWWNWWWGGAEVETRTCNAWWYSISNWHRWGRWFGCSWWWWGGAWWDGSDAFQFNCSIGWTWWPWVVSKIPCECDWCLFWTWGSSWCCMSYAYPWWWKYCTNADFYWWWGWGGWYCWCSWCDWIIYVRYKIWWAISSSTWWNCCYECDWYCIHKFTSNWTFSYS